MVALSQNEYSTVLNNDPARFNYSTLILTHDLNQWDETENQAFQEYMNWVNRGGHLIVLESLGNWPPSLGFANALSIYSENNVEADGIESQTGNLNFPSMIMVTVIHSSDVNVKIVASYTVNNEPVSPYALTKKVGNGEVTCLAVSPYFSTIENSTGDINRDFFRDTGSLLNVVDLKLKKNIVERTDYFPQINYAKLPIYFTGKVSIDTDFLQLPNLNANKITIVSNNEETKTINLNNSLIEKVEYVYPIKFRIDASEVHLSESALGTYLNIEVVGDFNLTMEIPKNGLVNVSLSNDTALATETFKESTVQLDIDNSNTIFAFVKNPTIIEQGYAFFNSARIYKNYYKMPLFLYDGSFPFEVIGKIALKIEYSDNGVIFLSDYASNITWFHITTEQEKSSFTEMDIPWFNVLTSSSHVLLVVMICAFTTFYLILKKMKTTNITVKLKWRQDESQRSDDSSKLDQRTSEIAY
jgi:hypothetical protein